MQAVSKAVVVAREASDSSGWPGLGFGAHALMPIANKPVLFHALEGLRAGGIEAVALAVGPKTRDDVERAVAEGDRWGLEVEYLDSPAEVGLVGILQGARDFLAGEPFMVQQGDALVRDELAGLRERFAGEGLDALVLRLTAADRLGDSTKNGSPTRLPGLGGCFLGPRALERVSGDETELPRLLAQLRRMGGRVRVEHVDGCLPCRGGRHALLDANRRALERIDEEPVRAELRGSEVQGSVVVHPTARLEGALVRGPAIIGPRAHIVHAYVGPYTSLGADVVIEGSEIEHSIVLDGAQIRFLGARLEASVVGREVRIGRDFDLPRAIHLVVADGAEVTLA